MKRGSEVKIKYIQKNVTIFNFLRNMKFLPVVLYEGNILFPSLR